MCPFVPSAFPGLLHGPRPTAEPRTCPGHHHGMGPMGLGLWVTLWGLGDPTRLCTPMYPQNPLGARVREVQRVPLDTVLSDQLVLPDIAL